MTVLTLDLGTSATKAALWEDAELLDLVRVAIPTINPAPGEAEQNPELWWRSVVDAATQLRIAAPQAYRRIEALGCSAARETFACFDRDLRPLSPGILWSDNRAVEQVSTLGDPIAFRRRTGVIASPGCSAAKVAWVRAHHPSWFHDAAWLLGPRDLVLARLTGHAQTDPTLASRTGLYALDGSFAGDDALAERLPPIIPSLQWTPIADPNELDLPPDAVAILGAGDRTCEAIGVDASASAPMVSWGTTVNVCVPHAGPLQLLPTSAQVSRGVGTDYLVEAGLSAAGAALDWLALLTGNARDNLVKNAAGVPPGANGVMAFPWLQGARAPWWRPDVHAAFTGVTSAHGSADLARAVIEGIALDTHRSVELLAPQAGTLQLAGAGAASTLWRLILAAIADCPLSIRALADAASVGARALIARAQGAPLDIDALNPIRKVDAPQADLVERYRLVRRASDAQAARLLSSRLDLIGEALR